MAEFLMPSLGADMEHGTILEWRVAPGDEVHRGDIIALVDTEKSEIEVEIWQNGVIDELLVGLGEEVPVGTVLATLTPTDGAGAAAPPQTPAAAEAEPPEAEPAPTVVAAAVPEAPVAAEPAPHPVVHSPVVRHLAEELGVDLDTVTGTGPGGAVTRADVEAARPAPAAPPPAGVGDRTPASPLARRLAAARGIDLATVTGSGPGGAVVGADVERAAAATGAGAAPAPAEVPPPAPTPPREKGAADRQEGMRKKIAQVMSRSNRDIPHYYVRHTIDVGRTLAWLEATNRDRSVRDRILPAAVLLAAVARAARQVPEVNGWWVDDWIRPAEQVNLGIIVSLRGGGIVAPGIPDADQLPVDELMARMLDLVARARAGRLRSSELSDQTITVTNLGDQGVEEVLGVIYPPQLAIVGLGRVVERPWAVDGMLAVRPVVTATLAADHRATDGQIGARYLLTLDRLLQEPEAL